MSDFVSVLLKTNDEDSKESMAAFIHQAIVRRHVVVELIESMQRRGHRAYAKVNLEKMRARAREELPEHGTMSGIAKLIPYDDLLSKIQIQKAATPVAVPDSMEAAVSSLNCLRPNAVVLERSSEAETDINAQWISLLQ